MPNRREFLSKTLLAGAGSGILARGGTQTATAEASTSTSTPKGEAISSNPLRILILGDTGFIGQHHVRAALVRGHKVTVFSRTLMLLPSSVEQLPGDREADLGSAQGRDWDAVIDTATDVPFRVRALGLALKGRVKHYTFISSINVYDHPAANGNPADESSSLLEYKGAADPYAIAQAEGREYGPLGVLCEREAQAQFPGGTLIVRPGYIVGPGDPTGAFTYWTVRMEKGGEILAAGDPSARVQMIDVRDMANWTVRMAEEKATGTFNAVGPARPLVWADMLGAIRARPTEPVKFTWVPDSWLQEQMVPMWSCLRFWPSEAATPGSMHMSNDKAQDRGLTFRSLAVTASDTLAWYKSQPKHLQTQLLLGFTGMFSVEDSMKQEQDLLHGWHSHQMKQS